MCQKWFTNEPLLGRAWASPTLVGLYCKTHVYVCFCCCCDKKKSKVPYMLQLEASPLRLPTLHSGSSPALPSTYWGYLHKDVQFSKNIYANLKFMVYGRTDLQHQAAHRPYKSYTLVCDHSGKARAWMALINASNSAHDFSSVKLSLFICSHSSCLLKLTPTMFYIF